MSKILSHLKAGKVADGIVSERRGALGSIHYEIAPGCFVHLALGAAALTIYHGDTMVSIPTEALIKLATQHEPTLAAPLPVDSKPETRNPKR